MNKMPPDTAELDFDLRNLTTRVENLEKALSGEPKELKQTVRQAAKNRTPLDGTDAQALEHALTITERERDAALEKLKLLTSAAEAFCNNLAPCSNGAMYCLPRLDLLGVFDMGPK